MPDALLLGGLRIGSRAITAGLIASAGLIGVYLVIISIAQGPAHAVEQLATDALFVGPIAVGFGTQVALFAELRKGGGHHRASAAVTVAGTGTSAAAMLACCAHHVVDLLPVLGLSAAAGILTLYKTPLFVLGIGMNVVGIVIVAQQLRRAQRVWSAMERIAAAA